MAHPFRHTVCNRIFPKSSVHFVQWWASTKHKAPVILYISWKIPSSRLCDILYLASHLSVLSVCLCLCWQWILNCEQAPFASPAFLPPPQFLASFHPHTANVSASLSARGSLRCTTCRGNHEHRIPPRSTRTVFGSVGNCHPRSTGDWRWDWT